MSWDLFVQNLPQGIRSVTEIPDDFEPGPLHLTRTELTAAIGTVWSSLDRSDPAWLIADGDSWSIEFNLGRAELANGFAMHVRGDHPPLREIATLLDVLGLRAIDPQTESGLFDLETAMASFGGGAANRDRST